MLLSPPRLLARFFRFALLHRAGRDAGISADDIRARDPEMVQLFTDFCTTLAAPYFRLRIKGIDHVPSRGAALLVRQPQRRHGPDRRHLHRQRHP